MPPRKPKAKKAAKVAPAGMAVSRLRVRPVVADHFQQGRSTARPAAKALPGAMKPSAPPAVAATPVPASAMMAPKTVNGGAARPPPIIPGRGAPPPPPPPPPVAAPPKEMYKALYNFTGQAGEMKLVKGEEVEVKEKDDNGKAFMHT